MATFMEGITKTAVFQEVSYKKQHTKTRSSCRCLSQRHIIHQPPFSSDLCGALWTKYTLWMSTKSPWSEKKKDLDCHLGIYAGPPPRPGGIPPRQALSPSLKALFMHDLAGLARHRIRRRDSACGAEDAPLIASFDSYAYVMIQAQASGWRRRDVHDVHVSREVCSKERHKAGPTLKAHQGGAQTPRHPITCFNFNTFNRQRGLPKSCP
jgi:hypothetical protein